MNWFGRFFRRRKYRTELDSELRFHAEQRAAELIETGVEPGEARRRAMVKLGGMEAIKQEYRESRATYFLEGIFQDVRYGLRALSKSPGFTTVAILTLALGIGANTAIFSLISAVLLKTLPVASPHDLVLFSDSPIGGSDSGGETGRWIFFSNDDYEYFREYDPSFKELCAFQTGWNNWEVRPFDARGKAEMAHGRLVSGNFFSFLGLRATVGRFFTSSDDRPGAVPTVVLNYVYWTRRFHGNPSVIGKTIEINRMDCTIIGVAPRTFSDVKYDDPDFWLPLSVQQQVMGTRSYAIDPQMYWLNMMGRLKPGVTLTEAQSIANAELKRILTSQAHPESAQKIAHSYIKMAPGAWGISYFRSTYMKTLQLVAGIVGIVLLIVCVNVALLLLSRGSAREQEISIRIAIGASRRRVIRQLLTESILLAAFGGTLGVLLARWGAELLAALVIGSSSVRTGHLDARMLLFAAVVSSLTGILCGLLPALRSSHVDIATRIRSSGQSRLRPGLANALAVFQIATCLVLLVGAGLLLRTLQKLTDQHLGFDASHVLVVRIHPEEAGYLPAQTPALYQTLIDRVEAIPGVASATVASSEPFSGSSSSSNFSIEGEPPRPASEMMVHKELVGPDYFKTQGIPILAGRDIGPQDRPGTPFVTVINQTMARQYFPGVNPIGRRFSLGSPFNPNGAMTIVGVAADARYYSLRDPIPPMEFSAAMQVPGLKAHSPAFAEAIEIRADGKPQAIATEVRAAVAHVSANLPVTQIDVLDQEVSHSLRQDKSYAELSTALAIIALLLACIGLYGTMAHRVSHRTREIGIRVALGAPRSGVLWMVIKECLLLAAVGLAIGAPAALAATKIISSELFRVSASDPATFLGVGTLLIVAVLLASWIPARRAMRVDPVVALRQE